MNIKKKKLAKRRSASKNIRSIAREFLHEIIKDPEKATDDDANKVYPWWEGKKIGQAEIIERQK